MKFAAALVLFALLVPAAPAQGDLDREVHAAYAAVEKARLAMGEDGLDDETRAARLEAFRKTALSFVEAWEDRRADMKAAHFDLARAYIDLQDPLRAVEHLELFLEKAPGSADAETARLFLGDALRASNRLPEAIAVFRAFLDERPGSERASFARLGLATTLYLDLRFDEAVAAYEVVLKEHPEHETAADAALQLVDALTHAGRFEEARTRLDGLLAESPEAPELLMKKATLDLLGAAAPDLVEIARWIGREPSSLERLRGRAVVLCFFMNDDIPSTHMLQWLSELSREMVGRPVTIWGLTKAYKAGRAEGWTLDTEAKWLDRYRKDPRFVVQRELRATPDETDVEEAALWSALEKPIDLPLLLASGFENHRNYQVRGVPCIVVIDKEGKVRLIEQGGQPIGGFQTRLIDLIVRRTAAAG